MYLSSWWYESMNFETLIKFELSRFTLAVAGSWWLNGSRLEIGGWSWWVGRHGELSEQLVSGLSEQLVSELSGWAELSGQLERCVGSKNFMRENLDILRILSYAFTRGAEWTWWTTGAEWTIGEEWMSGAEWTTGTLWYAFTTGAEWWTTWLDWYDVATGAWMIAGWAIYPALATAKMHEATNCNWFPC